MLDIKNYLFQEDGYVLIRMDNKFPSYDHRSDIDIVCFDTKVMAQKIKSRHIGKLIEHFPDGHHHLDYHNSRGLNFKFDLIDNFSFFNNIQIKNTFVKELLENVVLVELDKHLWKIPSQNYETAIRYFEWIEYPHKEKHKKYFDRNKNIAVEDILKRNIL